MPIQFSTFNGEDGSSAVSVFADGQLHSADDSHPNFAAIVAACEAAKTDHTIVGSDVIPLFDIAKTVATKFQRLSERVAITNGVITLDGDPVHGVLQSQILDFVEAGEDFDPLVNFYERLTTNPLGDVRDGLFQWITGRDGDANGGKVTITPEGKLLGYKSVAPQKPEWRTDEETVYVPSRRGEGIVNGIEVGKDQFIEQVVGDVVEMPRSKVLHAPSQMCGDGLHIGTFAYASTFYGGSVVMLVEFDPRDIVSLPDSNSAWKLRVCRYKVVEIVTEAVNAPVYATEVVVTEDPSDTVTTVPTLEGFKVGDRVATTQDVFGEDMPIGSTGTVVEIAHGEYVVVKPDEGEVPAEGGWYFTPDEIAFLTDEDPQELDVAIDPDEEPQVGDTIVDSEGDTGVVTEAIDEDGDVLVDYSGNTGGTGYTGEAYASAEDSKVTHRNGYSGPTSQAAKGRGRNPAQDDKGQFANGRPNSARDASTGRFA